MALIRADEAARLASPTAMRVVGRRIGVEGGTTGDTFAATQLPGARLTRYATVAEGLQALRAKQIDYLIHDAPTIWHLTGTPQAQAAEFLGLFTPLTDERLAWAVRKGNDSLRQRLNEALASLRQTGELNAILTRWIPTRIEIAPARRVQ
jgi:ABC-type amino acid transport substrate-binding protein